MAQNNKWSPRRTCASCGEPMSPSRGNTCANCHEEHEGGETEDVVRYMSRPPAKRLATGFIQINNDHYLDDFDD